MYPVSATSGPVDIIASGSFISYELNPIKINVHIPGFDLIINFDFIDDETDTPPTIIPSVSEIGELIVLLRNFKTSLGDGLHKPLEIGTYMNRKVYLNYRVYSLDETTDKLIHFSVYLERERKINS